ncbi:MAG: hypothetical protein H7837_14195 [Magnetococcus sp. MYC-9]
MWCQGGCQPPQRQGGWGVICPTRKIFNPQQVGQVVLRGHPFGDVETVAAVCLDDLHGGIDADGSHHVFQRCWQVGLSLFPLEGYCIHSHPAMRRTRRERAEFQAQKSRNGLSGAGSVL